MTLDGSVIGFRKREATLSATVPALLKGRTRMPNIGKLLRDEIARVAIRTSRGEIHPARKAAAQHRRAIALLKRQVAELERQVARLSRKAVAMPTATASAPGAKRARFVAK